jgi:hypothetical protein
LPADAACILNSTGATTSQVQVDKIPGMFGSRHALLVNTRLEAALSRPIPAGHRHGREGALRTIMHRMSAPLRLATAMPYPQTGRTASRGCCIDWRQRDLCGLLSLEEVHVALLWNKDGYGQIRDHTKTRNIPPMVGDSAKPRLFRRLARLSDDRTARPASVAVLKCENRAPCPDRFPPSSKCTTMALGSRDDGQREKNGRRVN